MSPRIFSLVVLPLLLSGCLGSSTGPAGSGAARIRLHVTGGFAGVDYTLYVNGPGGTVVGESCVSGCDFEDGAILETLSRDQAAYLAGLFIDAGIHAADGTDFGVQCCDQFHYELVYQDGDGTSSVSGSSEALPPDLRDAVSQVHGLLSGATPIVVAPQTSPEKWPSDWVSALDSLRIEGDHLRFRVSYGGGCAAHDFKLVAWGGWMESFPVQVRAFLSHDGKNDPCDAIVTRALSFDLRPLKKAYQESYGVGDPGATTLVIDLENPVGSSSLSHYRLEYVF
jgi:hypothetical protein